MVVVRHLALVSESASVTLADLAPTAAALQTQVIRDFAPAWRRPATVTAFDKLSDVPLDHWPMIVKDDIPYEAQGIHLDKDGAPFSLVLYSEGWSLTTSHEALEMLGDPLGKRTRRGLSPQPDQGEVRFLVEVCDPSEGSEFGYEINGYAVSDFYLPAYFDETPTAGARYSFTSAIPEPRSVVRGGYVSWQETTSKHWWQQTWFGEQPEIRDLGGIDSAANPRRTIDALTDVPVRVMSAPATRSVAPTAAEAPRGPDGAQRDRATYLRGRVEQIVASAT